MNKIGSALPLPSSTAGREAEPGRTLRRGVLLLAAIATAGTAAELATERHWRNPIQLIPWVALGVLAIALTLLATRPDRRRVLLVRVLAVAVALTTVLGIFEHIKHNLNVGGYDAVYGASWSSLPFAHQLWYAATKTVGSAPPLAAGVLAQAALLTILATWRHPAARTDT
jgi:hypothetical protein